MKYYQIWSLQMGFLVITTLCGIVVVHNITQCIAVCIMEVCAIMYYMLEGEYKKVGTDQ